MACLGLHNILITCAVAVFGLLGVYLALAISLPVHRQSEACALVAQTPNIVLSILVQGLNHPDGALDGLLDVDPDEGAVTGHGLEAHAVEHVPLRVAAMCFISLPAGKLLQCLQKARLVRLLVRGQGSLWRVREACHFGHNLLLAQLLNVLVLAQGLGVGLLQQQDPRLHVVGHLLQGYQVVDQDLCAMSVDVECADCQANLLQVYRLNSVDQPWGRGCQLLKNPAKLRQLTLWHYSQILAVAQPHPSGLRLIEHILKSAPGDSQLLVQLGKTWWQLCRFVCIGLRQFLSLTAAKIRHILLVVEFIQCKHLLPVKGQLGQQGFFVVVIGAGAVGLTHPILNTLPVINLYIRMHPDYDHYKSTYPHDAYLQDALGKHYAASVNRKPQDQGYLMVESPVTKFDATAGRQEGYQARAVTDYSFSYGGVRSGQEQQWEGGYTRQQVQLSTGVRPSTNMGVVLEGGQTKSNSRLVVDGSQGKSTSRVIVDGVNPKADSAKSSSRILLERAQQTLQPSQLNYGLSSPTSQPPQAYLLPPLPGYLAAQHNPLPQVVSYIAQRPLAPKPQTLAMPSVQNYTYEQPQAVRAGNQYIIRPPPQIVTYPSNVPSFGSGRPTNLSNISIETVPRVQYERCVTECKNWETKYNELYLRYMNLAASSPAQAPGDDAERLREENFRLKRQLKEEEEYRRHMGPMLESKFSEMVNNQKQATLRQCTLLIQRFKLESKQVRY